MHPTQASWTHPLPSLVLPDFLANTVPAESPYCSNQWEQIVVACHHNPQRKHSVPHLWDRGLDQLSLNYRGSRREFPGGPVVSTGHFHCLGLSSIPVPGTKIPQAVQHGQKKKDSVMSRDWCPSRSIVCNFRNFDVGQRQTRFFKNTKYRDYPGGPWLRICLPMQRTWVWSQIGGLDSTCCRATKPVCSNYREACAPQHIPQVWPLRPSAAK